jgi:hypothetical protein
VLSGILYHLHCLEFEFLIDTATNQESRASNEMKVTPLLLFSLFFWSTFPMALMATVTFEESSVIECTGLETLAGDDLQRQLENCSYVEDSRSLCSFSSGACELCIGWFAFPIGCDYNEQSGNVSTVRYAYGLPQKCPTATAQCGDNCIGTSAVAVIPQEATSLPTEMACPVADDTKNYSCSYSTGNGGHEYNWTSKSITNSSGTFYSIKTLGVHAVCDKECSVKTSGASSQPYWGRNCRLSVFCLFVLSTTFVVAGW